MAEASAALESFIDETIRRSKEKGYHPTIFIGLRKKLGTIPSISKLVESGDIQSGFKKLCSLGMQDWTIEAAVIQFANEFPKKTRECAEFRLKLIRTEAHKEK